MLVFSFLNDRAFESVDAHGAVMIVAQKEPFQANADPTSHRVRLWRGGSASTAINPPATEVKAFSVLVADGRVSEPAHDHTQLQRH